MGFLSASAPGGVQAPDRDWAQAWGEYAGKGSGLADHGALAAGVVGARGTAAL